MRSIASDSRTISLMRLVTGTRSEKSRLRIRSVFAAMRDIDRDTSSEAASAPMMAKATAMAAAPAARSSSVRELAASSATGTAAATRKLCPSASGTRLTMTR